MRKLQRSAVSILVALATVMSAPAAIAAPVEDKCDSRDVFLAADGRTDVSYFERQMQLDGDLWVLLQQVGINFRDSEQLSLPAGLYEFQNIIESHVIVDEPGTPNPRLGYSLRTQIYTANTPDPPVFEAVYHVWDLNALSDGVRTVGSCLVPD